MKGKQEDEGDENDGGDTKKAKKDGKKNENTKKKSKKPQKTQDLSTKGIIAPPSVVEHILMYIKFSPMSLNP